MMSDGRSQSPRSFPKLSHLSRLHSLPRTLPGDRKGRPAPKSPSPRGLGDSLSTAARSPPLHVSVLVIPGLRSFAFSLVRGLGAWLGLKNGLWGGGRGNRGKKRSDSMRRFGRRVTSWVPHVTKWHFHRACTACCSPHSPGNRARSKDLAARLSSRSNSCWSAW